MMVSISAYAGGNHHHTGVRDGIDGRDGINGTNGIDGVDGKDGVNASTLYRSGAIAAAAASGGHQVDYRTNKPQWSLVVVNYRDKRVPSFAIGKRHNGNLYTLSATSESSFKDLEDVITMISVGGTF